MPYRRLECRKCGKTETVMRDSIPELIEVIKNEGWQSEPVYPEDRCPDCTKNQSERKNNIDSQNNRMKESNHA